MPAESFSNVQIFSLRYVTAFLHLGTLDDTSALCSGAILNSKITNKKHKNGENVALAGNAALGDSDFSPLCSCLQMTAKALQALIWGVTNKF